MYKNGNLRFLYQWPRWWVVRDSQDFHLKTLFCHWKQFVFRQKEESRMTIKKFVCENKTKVICRSKTKSSIEEIENAIDFMMMKHKTNRNLLHFSYHHIRQIHKTMFSKIVKIIPLDDMTNATKTMFFLASPLLSV